jgi:predicted Rdx family selenoprotein
VLPRDGKCFTCATPGITSFFDSCNRCSCAQGRDAGCTELACIALAPENGSCERRCDGAVIVDKATCTEFLCINGAKTNPVTLPRDRCAPQSDACANNACQMDEKCVPEPKQCVREPCPQYRCEKPTMMMTPPRDGKCLSCATPGVTSFFDGCNSCSCDVKGSGSGLGAICTLRACLDSNTDDKAMASSCANKCDGALVTDGCTEYVCMRGQRTSPVKIFGGACNTNNQTPRDGKCFSCSTPGISSFFDGCNQCRCGASPSMNADEKVAASCSELACITLAPAEGSCERRCDGALVKSRCEECLCRNGRKTECVPVKDCKDDDDSTGASSMALTASILLFATLATFL